MHAAPHILLCCARTQAVHVHRLCTYTGVCAPVRHILLRYACVRSTHKEETRHRRPPFRDTFGRRRRSTQLELAYSVKAPVTSPKTDSKRVARRRTPQTKTQTDRARRRRARRRAVRADTTLPSTNCLASCLASIQNFRLCLVF